MRYDRNAAEAIYDHAQHPPAIEASVEAGAPGGVELGDMQMVAGIAEHDLRRRLACTAGIKTAADCPDVSAVCGPETRRQFARSQPGLVSKVLILRRP
jgi:hypothetical protein